MCQPRFSVSLTSQQWVSHHADVEGFLAVVQADEEAVAAAVFPFDLLDDARVELAVGLAHHGDFGAVAHAVEQVNPLERRRQGGGLDGLERRGDGSGAEDTSVNRFHSLSLE